MLFMNGALPIQTEFSFPGVITGDNTGIDPSVTSDVHLRLESPNDGDQQMISFSFQNTPKACLRVDDTSFMCFHSDTIGYSFYDGLDNSTPILTIRPTAIYAVQDFYAQSQIHIGGTGTPEFILFTRIDGSDQKLICSTSGIETVLATVPV